MDTRHCLVEREGHVLIVTLNRPEAKNALSPGMLLGMYRAWRELDEDPDLRVAILTGTGDVFCAGADLKAMAGDQNDAEFQELIVGGPIFATKDAREGPRAFAEKREPVFTGE